MTVSGGSSCVCVIIGMLKGCGCVFYGQSNTKNMNSSLTGNCIIGGGDWYGTENG